MSARDGTVLADGEVRHAAWIASRATALAATSSGGTVTRFGGEYGFVFKRLPVQRVLLDDILDSSGYAPGRQPSTIDLHQGACVLVLPEGACACS